MEMIVYTDGSYDSNRHQYGGGIVIVLPNVENPLEYKVNGSDNNYNRLRNIAGEILAVLAAIKIAKETNYKRLTIYFDYEGIQKFITGEMTPRKVLTISYTEQVKQVIEEGMEINFQWIKGHGDNKLHNRAHVLAREAAKEVRLDA